MRPVTRQALLIGMVAVGLWYYQTMRPVPQPPGILVQDAPKLTALADDAPTFVRNEHVFTALARLETRGRVLSIERYGRDRESQAALADVALGWGRMSDSVTLKNVDVAQSDRRVLSKSYDPNYSDSEVEANILNLHLITSDPEAEKKITLLRSGNIVHLSGYLVEAVAGDGWRWKGQVRERPLALPGTLLWVEQIEIEGPATKS